MQARFLFFFLRKIKSSKQDIYSLNYFIHVEVMLSNMKAFIILFLLCLWEQGIPWQFLKQISKLSFQLSVQIYSLLGQTEGEREAFFGEYKKGSTLWDYPKAFNCHKRWKSLFFCEIWNNPTSPLFSIRPTYK